VLVAHVRGAAAPHPSRPHREARILRAMTTSNDPRPLAGVTVLDMTRVLAGPFCTLQLSNLGARVIKIERPPDGDDARAIGPFVGGKSLYFSSLNYGKESIALDLRRDEDRAIFDDLLGTADVLVENFRPGVLERLGYGWPTLHARWPALVYAAASGFGHTGPLRERPAFDLVAQAMGGIVSLTGHADGPPARVGVSIGDIAAGLFLATGITSALYRRCETGLGTMIDVAMLDCQLAILENALTTHLVTGSLPGRLGTRHPNIAPFQAFATGDGRPIVVCAGHDDLFAKFCAVIERPELTADARFRTADGRRRHVDDLEALVQPILATRTADEWLARLERAGVPCAPVNTVAEAVRQPQVAARHMVVGIPDPAIGTLYVAGNPIKISDVPESPPTRSAPDVDADRDRILAAMGRRR
jgi:CoA:oxalate CoA-transferase